MPDEYPTEAELAKIEQWDTVKYGVYELAKYVIGLWKYHSTIERDTEFYSLTLHTGGWSGNEDIITALIHNDLFWAMTWQKSTRGGHYWFKWKKESEK